MLKIHKPYVEEIANKKKILDQKVIKHHKEHTENKNKIEKLGSKVEECNKQAPEKHQEAYGKCIALKNQHEAISTNGIVKDIDHHNKVLDKINADKSKSLADKMREQSQVQNNNIGSLSPSRTPNINATNNKNKTKGI